MAGRIKVTNLIECLQHAPTISKWCWDEWEIFNIDLGLNSEEEFLEDLTASCTSKQFLPICLVAIGEDDTPLGCVQLEPCDMSIRDNLTPWMTCLFVEPAHRQQGVASALQHAFLQLCRDLKIPKVYLWTEDQQDMYSRRGWVFHEDVEYLGHATTIMSYDIDNA